MTEDRDTPEDVAVLSDSIGLAPLVVLACTVRNGRLVSIVSIMDPVRLAGLDLPDSD